MKHLITGGKIIDGTGADAYPGSVLIRDNKIEALNPSGTIEDAQIIDANGMIVCPAFIDIHRHLDAKPLLGTDMEAELRQGIATAVAGNCGFSLAPNAGPFFAEKRRNDLPILGAYPEHFRFTFPQYMDALEKSRPALNTAAMIGLGAIRICQKGFSSTPFTHDELCSARDMIGDALLHGAAGISAGIMYLPEFHTTHEEYKVLLHPLKGGQKPLVAHIRGEGDSLVKSVDEVLQIAADAQCPLEISHFKSCGKNNWNREIHRAIDLIEKARAKGQDVTVDFYPYLGGSTALTTMVPPAFIQGDLQRALERMGTQEGVHELRKACSCTYMDWDNYAISLGWDRILISGTSAENQKYLGMSVQDAAEKYDFEDAVALAAHLMHTDLGQTTIINLSMDQRDVDAIAALDYSTLISDAIYTNTDTPHPRMYGAFPRFIEQYVCKRPVLTLEKAVRKMTSQPAARMQLSKRGTLQHGSYADILIFDPAAMHSDATYQSPAHLGQGIHTLLVNGETRISKDHITGQSSGQCLRIR